MRAVDAILRTLRAVLRTGSPPAWAAFVVALLARFWLIHLFPWNYSFDAYQRWGGREWLLVQGWLPATQSVVWAVDRLGGGLTVLYVALSVVAALAHAAGTRVAEWFGGRTAGWAFVALGVVGPFLAWSRVPYQEATFLLFLLGGLAQAASGRWTLADVLVGAVGLVRYEGWAFVLLYMAWRGSPRALLAGWGVAAWLVVYGVLGLRGHASSPVDFDDWEGLSERVTVGDWLNDVGGFGDQAWNAGTVPLAVAGVWGAVVLWKRRRRDVLFLLALLAAQIGITLVWIAGLEIATYRMQVVPAFLLGLLGAAAAADLWDHVRDARARRLVEALLLLWVPAQIDEGAREVRMSVNLVSEERAAVRAIQEHPDVVWWVEPRAGLGTRNRHDGCEALQGLMDDFRHGEDFFCGPWLTLEESLAARPKTNGLVRWADGDYEVWPQWPPPEGDEAYRRIVRVPARDQERTVSAGYAEPEEATPQ